MSDSKLTLSKSQYVKGLKCPLSLWFYRAAANQNKPELKTSKESDASREARRAMGDKVGELAKSYFKKGVEVTAGWQNTEQAAEETQGLIDGGEEVIFEATAINPDDGSYCSIDILRKVKGKDEWDMIEVKSSTKVKPEHRTDIAFQRHVFEGAGYNIRHCYIMHIDNSYERDGEIDPKKLFKLQNVNRSLKKLQPEVAPNLANLVKIVDSPQPPTVDPEDKKCTPRTCDSAKDCWGALPLYSVFNAYGGAKGFKQAMDIVAKTGSYDIADIPEDMKPNYEPKRIELESQLSGKPHVDQKALGEFLDDVEYPVYYLDYETVMSGIPLYDGTRPYQQVPFQFSLHVQEEPGGELKHVEFLHKQTDDPRRAFAEALVNACGDKGSVIVYSDFEEKRNNELATAFPDLAPQIESINERIVDLYKPFQQRWLYDPSQRDSASIKVVLPAFTNISYDNLDINNGEQALQEYMAFVTGFKTDPKELEALWEGLEEYCEQDTYAMVELLDVLHEKAGRAIQSTTTPDPVPEP